MATLSLQHTLQKLPVPTLEETLSKYIRSIEPLATSEELQRSKALAKDFLKPGGLGQTLQQRLLDVDRAAPDNWLDDTWWIRYGAETQDGGRTCVNSALSTKCVYSTYVVLTDYRNILFVWVVVFRVTLSQQSVPRMAGAAVGQLKLVHLDEERPEPSREVPAHSRESGVYDIPSEACSPCCPAVA